MLPVKDISSNKANLRDLIAATGLVILLKLDSNCRFFQPVWPWNLMDDPGKIIGHFFYITSSFVHHLIPLGESKLELLSGKAQFGLNSGQNRCYLSRVNLKFDGWPWTTIGHLFCATLSFVHHFKAIGVFKLELQSGNTQFWAKSTIYCPAWPWNLMDDLERQ